jgi:phage host-nuclease inhibitor protein Gam
MAASVSLSGVGPSGSAGQGIATINAFPDEKKIRELTEQIRRLCHAHQLKLTASQQQQLATPAASMQVLTLTPPSVIVCQCHDNIGML